MSVRLQILVSDELARRVRNVAARSRLSQSEWVRRLIERALERDRPGSDALAELARLNAPTTDIDRMIQEIEDGRS